MDPAIHQALENSDIEKIQDLWTDMVLDSSIPETTFYDITDYLDNQGLTDLAADLLDMIASHYDSERKYDRAISICKHLLRYRKESNEIRQRLIELYRKEHMESENLNAYLELSGVSAGEPILKSLARLDEFLQYDVGTYFYFEKYGVGKVIEVYPNKKEIVLDFEKIKRHFLAINVAKGLLTPLDKDHFLYLKHTTPAVLKEMTEAEPVKTVIKLLQDWNEPLTGAQIKTLFHGIVADHSLNKFWDTVRKQLEKDPHIETRGRTNKNYSYAESIVDKEAQARSAFDQALPREKYVLMTDFVVTMPDIFHDLKKNMITLGNKIHQKDPALALDILLFCQDHKVPGEFLYTVRSLLEENESPQILKKIIDPGHQKEILQIIQEMNPGTWTKLFKKILLTVNQPKVLDEVYSSLKEQPNIVKDTLYTILSRPIDSPHAYRWMLKKMIDNDLPEYNKPAFLPRIIESVDHITGIRSMVISFLSLDRFDKLIKQASIDEAQRILDTVLISESLEEYQKNDMTKIIEYHHPDLAKQEMDIIYTTAHALKKRQAELDRLLSEDIPANRKEISRAREFGDLSENFEYKAAREKQSQLMEKTRIIEQEITHAEIIDPARIPDGVVSIGTRVLMKDKDGQSNHFTILGRWDTDLEKHIISNEAPAAKQLLGKTIGDTVTIQDTVYIIEHIEKAL